MSNPGILIDPVKRTASVIVATGNSVEVLRATRFPDNAFLFEWVATAMADIQRRYVKDSEVNEAPE
jgi:hypothetical protein